MRALSYLLLPINCLFALVCVCALLRAAITGDFAFAKAAVVAALIWAGYAFRCYREIREDKKKHAAFLRSFEGRPIEEALAAARSEALALPPGLVREKVKVPFTRWVAFEHDAFQFVLAEDEHGLARAFTI